MPIEAVRAAVGSMAPGPFAYAERWEEKEQRYVGLAVQNTADALVVIDPDSVIVKPEVPEKYLLQVQPDPVTNDQLPRHCPRELSGFEVAALYL